MNAQEPLSDDAEPDWDSRDAYDEEKVEFPSGRAALPTFSAAFGPGTPPSQMKFGPPRLGPRFNNPSLEPFDPQPSAETVSSEQTIYSKTSQSRSNSSASRGTIPIRVLEENGHVRSASVNSQKSYSSYRSDSSFRSNGSSRTAQSYGTVVGPDRRWMIE